MNTIPQMAAAGLPQPLLHRRTRPKKAPHWVRADVVAGLMILVIAIRLHEFVPLLYPFKPAVLTMVLGLTLLWRNTAPAVRRAALAHPVAKLTFAYLGFMVLTVPFALWKGLAFETVQAFLPAVALLIAMLMCRPDSRTTQRLQAVFVFGAAAYALYAKLFGRTFADDRLMAGNGMYDSNDMAALLAMAFPLALGLTYTSRSVLRIASSAATLLLVTVVVASGSRGGGLALGVGAAVFALGMKGHRRVVAAMLLLAGTMILWNSSPGFRSKMSTLTHLEDDYNTTAEAGRKQVWQRARGYIKDHPVLGVGIGNFPVAEGDWYAATYQGWRGGKWSAAHNAYLQAYAELGIAGGSVFILLLGYGVRRSWNHGLGSRRGTANDPARPELLAALSSFMVGAYFLSHAYFLPLFALLGLIGLYHTHSRLTQRLNGSRLSVATRPVPFAARGG